MKELTSSEVHEALVRLGQTCISVEFQSKADVMFDACVLEQKDAAEERGTLLPHVLVGVGRALGRRWLWAAGSAVVASVLVAALILQFLGGHPALAETVRQLKEAQSLLIEITSFQWPEGHEGAARELHGKAWIRGEKQFSDFPDRKQWVLPGEHVTYYPARRRVFIRKVGDEDLGETAAFSVDEVIAQLKRAGLEELPWGREEIEGREYTTITMVLPGARDADIVFYVNPKTQRLDYLGYRMASGPLKGRFVSWMKYTYNPEIDENLFKPTYPDDAQVEWEGQRESTEDVVDLWRRKAVVTSSESGGVEVGLLEAWLAPDGLLGLHLFEYKVWTSGTAFPDEVFDKKELTKGGFAPEHWRNTNVVLEYPEGVARRLSRNVPLSGAMGHPGKGP